MVLIAATGCWVPMDLLARASANAGAEMRREQADPVPGLMERSKENLACAREAVRTSPSRWILVGCDPLLYCVAVNPHEYRCEQ